MTCRKSIDRQNALRKPGSPTKNTNRTKKKQRKNSFDIHINIYLSVYFPHKIPVFISFRFQPYKTLSIWPKIKRSNTEKKKSRQITKETQNNKRKGKNTSNYFIFLFSFFCFLCSSVAFAKNLYFFVW